MILCDIHRDMIISKRQLTYYYNIFQYFKQSLGPRLSIVYLESWKEQDQLPGFKRVRDISTALKDFQDYLTRKLYKVDRDSSQLLT